ncbi:tRNA 4-thiouridine(8) synthase ThiI [Clostridium bornimense]|uniref:tRNA uracil 4-sulfurtransferase ThiI n=1 Tax=Clostridium bornimense TaxID=1216932 RepID=UPI001C1064B0|nr:tRNA uracil 4-sulfurtransferase ThiI [Clostridium bornimense]MBU5317337.1 tRNA 4-thiouridine(8) synthase ThiI [Clostridium bornimense]
MRKLILVKYASEIFLKGLNRNKFEQKLMENIKKVLKDVPYEFIRDDGRTFIYSEDIELLVEKVSKVFGVKEICIVDECEVQLEAICNAAILCAKELNGGTFKVESNRANKEFPMNSMELSRYVGSQILQNTSNLSVDVREPDNKIYVEVRKKAAYVYSKKVKAVGGMPYGTNGGTVLMLSGGIDSPVAGYLMARRGVKVSAVYYHSHPYTSERAKEKVVELARILKNYTGEMKLFVVPFTEIQMEIMKKCREDELTIIMRRFMMRVACKIADSENFESVTTGESIGQVASQTMESLVVTDNVSDRPAFRPLISMDKEDIIEISREIGTYDTSILPYEDCCTIFVPKHPKTRPVLKHIEASEEALDIESLVDKAIEGVEIISL